MIQSLELLQPRYDILNKNREGYKYRLTERYEHHLLHRAQYPEIVLSCTLHSLYGRQGVIAFEAGYCWDGCSGPTIDRPVTMLASLVHDGFYQLMRERLLEQRYRADADWEFYDILDVHHFTFAKLYHVGVSTFAGYAARPR